MTYEHGGDIYTYAQQCGIKEEDLLDFSVNTNPFGMPEVVKEALINQIHLAELYPDTRCRRLVEALSAYHHIQEKHILCTNGAADLIFRLTQVIKPKVAWVLAPTFVEYQQALESVGSCVKHFYLKEEYNFRLKEDFLTCLTEEVDMVFICNPNNPTGQVIELDLLRKILEQCMQKNIYMVVDECFMEFVEKQYQASIINQVMNHDKLIILKAFTKLYALAGLRLGYGLIGDVTLRNQLEKVSQPWAVSSLAQVAGVTALTCKDYVGETLRSIEDAKKICIQALEDKGITVYGSYANYIFFRVASCDWLREELLHKHILIRDCSNYSGLKKGFYRIGVRTKEENERFIAAIGEVMDRLTREG